MTVGTSILLYNTLRKPMKPVVHSHFLTNSRNLLSLRGYLQYLLSLDYIRFIKIPYKQPKVKHRFGKQAM